MEMSCECRVRKSEYRRETVRVRRGRARVM